MTSSKHRGFSLLEMLIVISISLILAGITSLVWGPVMNQQHVTSAYNATLTTLRRAAIRRLRTCGFMSLRLQRQEPSR